LALTPGTRLGVYEVTAQIGEGGMGQVYRATDTKLKRQVAIKILPPSLAADHDRLARFQREAEVLASLNHPHIAGIYGLEESEGVFALVMEFVEGEDLSQLISRGAIPIDESLPIAKQIADALEAAHEQGIIHRDLKPANIKVRADGTVKVLDFGLAKAFEPAAAMSANATMSPTITTPAMTQAGVILGTAAYMSPEQARGRAVDKRTDVWAFGCVLFEMLSGARAVAGEDVVETIGAVVHKEPDWTRLPATTPATVRTVLQRCLQKDPKQRIRDMGDVRLALTGAFDQPPHTTASATQPAAAPRYRMIAAATAAVGAGALVAAITTWALTRPASQKLQPVRFAIVPPAPLQLFQAPIDHQLVISPDGTLLAYVATPGPGSAGAFGGQLVVRPIDQVEAEPLRGIAPASSPFFSPDGKWIGYFDGNIDLKKVSVTGGAPVSLCLTGRPNRGGSWAGDTIVFATDQMTTGLLSVSAGGGEPTVITKPDAAQGEAHSFPSHLPGGNAVLYTVTADRRPENARVEVLDLRTGQSKTLVRGGAQAEYVELSADTRRRGFLVYAVAGALRAVQFDPIKLEVHGESVPVLPQVMTFPTGAAQYTVSRTGALAYIRGVASAGVETVPRTLVWVDRRGHEETVAAPPRSYVSLKLSPDGTTVALDVRDKENDIWTLDIARRTMTRLTTDLGVDGFPVWMPDGRRILFESNRAGSFNLYSQAADGTGVAEQLTKSPNQVWPYSVSPDGTRAVLNESGGKKGSDLDVLVLDGKSRLEPLMQSPFNKGGAAISPDGDWLAYNSDESGQPQVYVRPFPNVNDGQWPVSPAGGSKPVWAPSGKELFYLVGNQTRNTVMVVPVQTTPTFRPGNATKLFEGPYTSLLSGRPYDVSRDGQKFLMIKEPQSAVESAASPASIVVVLNWIEELKARVPTK
jgi:hypothetical protein